MPPEPPAPAAPSRPRSRALRPAAPALALLLALAGAADAHRFFLHPGGAGHEHAFAFDGTRLSTYAAGRLEPGDAAWFRVDAPPGSDVAVLVLAPITCPAFRPELWVASPSLDPAVATPSPPFALPFGWLAARADGAWRPYQDQRMTARVGPAVRAILPDAPWYAVVRAPAEGPSGAPAPEGRYLAVKAGLDGFGGTPEGLAAFQEFLACGELR